MFYDIADYAASEGCEEGLCTGKTGRTPNSNKIVENISVYF